MVKSIKILTSAIGFGGYIPAVIVGKQLSSRGIRTSVYVIEKFLSEEKKEVFRESRVEFRNNNRIAYLASQLPIDYNAKFEIGAMEKLFDQWKHEGASTFLCFSGLWLDVMAAYQDRFGKIDVYCCRMDATESSTWKDRRTEMIRETFFFFDVKKTKINYLLTLPSLVTKPFSSRENSVVIHGGGWGLGNYIHKSNAITSTSFTKKLFIFEKSEFLPDNNNTSFYLNNPNWDPIAEDSGFPPLGQMISHDVINYIESDEYHAALQVINDSKAIISKPGGMSLLDSIITETPLVYLETAGINEEGNKKLLESLDLGISFGRWADIGFDKEILNKLNRNLTAVKKEIPDFTSMFLDQMLIN